MGDKDKLEIILRFKTEDPEQFHCLVKMHLSFLLDMNTDECDCSFLYDHLYPGDHGTPKRKSSLLQSSKGTGITCTKKGIMEGATLTMEGVCQIFQIIQFLVQKEVCNEIYPTPQIQSSIFLLVHFPNKDITIA